MRVLLIYPPVTMHKTDISPPSKPTLIGLAYLASAIRNTHRVSILDCSLGSHPTEIHDLGEFKRYGLTDVYIARLIKSYSPDAVGITSMYTPYAHDAHTVARIVKEINPSTLVVFGGAHATAFPELVVEDPNVDCVVVGEGETVFGNVLERRDRITYAEPIHDLDNLRPAWDLIGTNLTVQRDIQRLNPFLIRKPMAYVLTSRGCPKSCYFCSVRLAWGQKWRARSAKSVVDEITELHEMGYNEIHFLDDNSSVSRSRMVEMCELILERQLDVKITTPTGIAIQTLDYDLLRLMKRAGFYRLCFGVETGVQRNQFVIKKHIDLKRARETIRNANRLGFWTAATFIIGFPHETRSDIDQTFQFAYESGLDFAVFYLLTPQPGTEVYEILKSDGLVDFSPYMHYNSPDWWKIGVTYFGGSRTAKFTNTDLKTMLSTGYKHYLRRKLANPLTYWRVLTKIRSLEDAQYALSLSKPARNLAISAMRRTTTTHLVARYGKTQPNSEKS